MIIYLAEGRQKYNGEWIRSIKIGHSNNFKNRGKSYNTDCGPNFTEEQVIAKKKGSRMLERMFQIYFKKFAIMRKVTGRLSEWCFYNEEMIRAFEKENEKSLGLLLWRNKEVYLDPQRRKPGKAKKVYDYLKSIYQKPSNSYICKNSKEDEENNSRTKEDFWNNKKKSDWKWRK